MRASGSQISGYGYGSCDSVQAPLTLITAFGRFASASTFGRSAHASGGAGGVVEYRNRAGELSRWDYWSSEAATTNNRMALRSVIDAFTLLSRKGKRFRVCFTSDSQYLVKGMSDWVFGWMSRGWRKRCGKCRTCRGRRCFSTATIIAG